MIVNKAQFISIKYKHAKCQITRLLCKVVVSNLAFTTGVNYVSNANTHKRDIPWFRYNTLWNRHQTIKPQKLTTLCGNPGMPLVSFDVSCQCHFMSINGWLKQYLFHLMPWMSNIDIETIFRTVYFSLTLWILKVSHVLGHKAKMSNKWYEKRQIISTNMFI